jgi:hypothetical protein
MKIPMSVTENNRAKVCPPLFMILLKTLNLSVDRGAAKAAGPKQPGKEESWDLKRQD